MSAGVDIGMGPTGLASRGTGPATAGRPIEDGVATGLLIVAGATVALMLALGLLIVETIPFVVGFAVLAWFAARTPSTRLRWAVVAATLVFVAANAPFAIPDLQHPESAPSFIPTLVVMVSAITTAILAVRAARRRPASGRAVWVPVSIVLALAAVVSLAATAGVEDAIAQPGDVVVAAQDTTYPDIQVGADAGAVVIDNADRFRHTFAVEGLIEPVEVPASTSVRVPLSLAPGTYRYHCTLPGHEAMEATLTVG